MRDKITQAINATLPQYLADNKLPDVYDVNCGLCEDFAGEIIDQLGGETDSLYMVWIEDLIDTPFPDASHSVICLNNNGERIFFDAECPEGTTDVRKIPAMVNQGVPRDEVIAQRKAERLQQIQLISEIHNLGDF